jgi:predicted Zn-ribbon and HTH transcriptional regulator
MSDPETTERVLDVLRDADEPLGVSTIQRRLATRSRDVTTGVIREICREQVKRGSLEATDDTPPAYRLVA